MGSCCSLRSRREPCDFKSYFFRLLAPMASIRAFEVPPQQKHQGAASLQHSMLSSTFDIAVWIAL